LPTSSIFDSARQKYKRAKQHAVEFNSMEQNYLKQACNGILTEGETNSGEQVVKLNFSKPVPIEIASVVSDAANNLRDSLDHMGYATAQAAKKGSNPKHTSFPFAATATQLENSINGRAKDIPADILTLFRNLRPHKGGDEQLYALNTIANANKHQLLRPMALSTGLFNLSLGNVSGGMVGIPQFSWNPDKNELILLRFGKETAVNISTISVQAFLVFDEGTIDAGDPVGRILDGLISRVENILNSVEAEARRIGLIT
jgi:hypothetical protein